MDSETREQSYGKCPGKLEAEGTSRVKTKTPPRSLIRVAHRRYTRD